jgi:hypothetical protein
MKRLFFVFAAAVSASGCFFPKYEPPVSGETAMLDTGGFDVYLFSNEQCDNPQRTGFDLHSKPAPIKVQATGPLFLARVVDTRGLPSWVYCISLASFTPVPGQSYKVNLDMGSNSCRLTVLLLLPSGETRPQPVTYHKITSKCDDGLGTPY